MLHPDRGDDPARFVTVPFTNPVTGKRALRIPQMPNGDCYYLDEGGCSIHDRAPVVCREFDCRRFVTIFEALPAAQRKQFRDAGLIDDATLAAGRLRIATL